MKGAKFKVDGKEYTWILTPGRAVEMEGILKGDFGLKEVREIMRLGLEAEHPGLTDEEVGRIMDSLGFYECIKILSQAFLNVHKKMKRQME